jgi:hypothetical protein
VGPISEKKRFLVLRGSLVGIAVVIIALDLFYLSGSEYGKGAAIAAPMGLLLLLPVTRYAKRKSLAIAAVILSAIAQWIFIALFHHLGA